MVWNWWWISCNFCSDLFSYFSKFNPTKLRRHVCFFLTDWNCKFHSLVRQHLMLEIMKILSCIDYKLYCSCIQKGSLFLIWELSKSMIDGSMMVKWLHWYICAYIDFVIRQSSWSNNVERAWNICGDNDNVGWCFTIVESFVISKAL